MNQIQRKIAKLIRQHEVKKPGILDNLLNAQSHDEACEIWTSFQNQNPKPSQKTINRAMRILTAHMEGRVI